MSAPAEHLAWSKGGHAEIVGLDGDVVVVRSTSPAPPGARLEGVLCEDGGAVTIKSHGSKKEEDGSFTLRGRLIDATRALRDRLRALGAR